MSARIGILMALAVLAVAAEAAGRLMTKDLPHWQFSGLFESSKPSTWK